MRPAPALHAPASACVPCTLAGLPLWLHPAGVAFHAPSATLIVADLHLEKGTAFAALGQMLPPYETLETLRRLHRVAMALAPARLVLLGDSFHARQHALAPEGEALGLVADLARQMELIWIAGNHDPAPPLALPGRSADAIMLEGVILRHAPVEDGASEIVGHLHPAATLATRAGRQRRKGFMLSHRRLLMPAFGTLTGGIDMRDPRIACWFPEPGARAFLLCRDRIEALPVSALINPGGK
jgi:uncharacterized protein